MLTKCLANERKVWNWEGVALVSGGYCDLKASVLISIK